MRIGAITRQGYSITVRLGSGDVTISASMSTHEAEELLAGLLLNLAQADPVKWESVFDDVREQRRIRT